MKKFRAFMLLLVVMSLMLCVGCNLNENYDDNANKNYDDNSNNGDNSSQDAADLQLLRIETTESTNGIYPGLISPWSSAKSTSSRAVTLLSTKSTSRQAVIAVNTESADNKVEEIESETVSLVAVIKNENRASFIDMVVYNSQTGKTVVYNEGNGAYQCSSETVYEDGMWVTNITFSVNVELTTDDFYFEIQEIKFLRNNTDEKADLNTLDVRKKDFRFFNEYFDKKATQKIKIDSAFFENVDSYYMKYDSTNSTVKIETGLYYADDEEIIIPGNLAKKVEIIVPESLTLQYYENKVLKTGEFRVAELRIKDIDGHGKLIHTIGELIINAPMTIDTEKKVYELKFAEGAKICLVPEGVHVLSTISIPSTCEEIDTNLELERDSLTINYNGTMAEFRNIKGAEDLISNLKNIGKTFQIVCNDGTISPSVN